MNLKSIIAATVIAVSSVSSFAATYNLGALGAGDTFLSGSEEAAISVANGSFSDTFNFSLSNLSDLVTAAGTLNFGKTKKIDTSFNFTLYNSSNLALGSGTSGTDFSLASLASGPYKLVVTGLATGTKGGLYNGVLSVTAVPEPETFALMLAGLGLMGTIARRRNKAAANA
jgi:hypothetical protein